MIKIKIYNDKKLKYDLFDERESIIKDLYRKTEELVRCYEYDFTSTYNKLLHKEDKRKIRLNVLIDDLIRIKNRIEELEKGSKKEIKR